VSAHDSHNSHGGHDEIDLRVGHPDDELSALLDGELDADAEAAVRRHLDGCEACRLELDEVADVRRALRAMPAVAAPEGLVGAAVDRRRRAERRGVAITLLAAVLALVLGLVAADVRGAPGWPGARAGDDIGTEQVALVDRTPRPWFPGARTSGAGATGSPRWDAGRPEPDARVSPPGPRSSPQGDDEGAEGAAVLGGGAHEAGREMLDLMGG
jgi:anti-sigma factor RsiW